jgi:hypothetical protein
MLAFYRKEVSKIRKPTEQEIKRLNMNLPISLHNAFKAATAARGENMTDVLMEYIRAYVEKHSPKGRRR